YAAHFAACDLQCLSFGDGNRAAKVELLRIHSKLNSIHRHTSPHITRNHSYPVFIVRAVTPANLYPSCFLSLQIGNSGTFDLLRAHFIRNAHVQVTKADRVELEREI